MLARRTLNHLSRAREVKGLDPSSRGDIELEQISGGEYTWAELARQMRKDFSRASEANVSRSHEQEDRNRKCERVQCGSGHEAKFAFVEAVP
jgi:hypothetical protein